MSTLKQSESTTAEKPVDQLFPLEQYKDTLLCRAMERSVLSDLLLRTRVGNMLIAGGLATHPVLAEQARLHQRLEKVALAYEKTGLLPNKTDFHKLAIQDPEFQVMQPPSLAGLEKTLDHKKTNNINEFLTLNNFETLRQLDYRVFNSESHPEAITSGAVGLVTTDIQEKIQDLFEGQLYSALRDKVLDLSTDRSWPVLIDLILQLHTVPTIKKQLTKLFKTIGPQLFRHPEFRKQLAYVMIRRIAVLDFDGQKSLAAYLHELGLPDITDQEMKKYLTDDFLSKSLENAWNYNQEKYFRAVQYLYEAGVLSEQYLRESTAFRRHVIEFALKALRSNINYHMFRQQVAPMVISWKVFDADELTLTNQNRLYTTYQKLCLVQNVPVDREVSKLFRRENHAQKWEE